MPGSVLGNLWRLLRLSGETGVRNVQASILITAFAAIADAASLALLKQTVSGAVSPDNAGNGGAAIRAAIFFLVAALVGSLLRLWALRRTAAAQLEVNRSLALRAFHILQHQEYTEYLRRGASEGFSTFERLMLISTYGLNSLVSGSAALLSVLVLLAAIAMLFPLAATILAFAMLLVALEAVWRSRTAAPAALSQLAKDRSVLLYEARTAFRDIFLTNSQDRICNDFARAETDYRLEQSRMTLASQSSRYTIEICGILTALVVLGFFSFQPLSDGQLAPLLAVTVLATFRLLPQVAALRSAYRLIALHADVSNDVRALLERPVIAYGNEAFEKIVLKEKLSLSSISFTRPDRPDTLSGLDLEIERGARIGILGESGVGKSTLLDILCGAISPDSGAVLVDGLPVTSVNARSWRDRIGIVSQSPVLLGRNIREAIVYPVELADVDQARFDAAVAQAGIADMLVRFPDGFDTAVGEVSSALSGGQRQRLALARALYRADDLLVLDEATGQLDEASEAAIISQIEKLPSSLTIIIASHRPAVFAMCNRVYRLSKGKLTEAG